MDRRLPIRPDTFTAQMARRELILEQRLDRLYAFRPRSQQYLNDPCCVHPSLVLLGVGPDDIPFDGCTATYAFEAPVNSVSFRSYGTAPSNDGRGYGLQIEIRHNGTLLVTAELTGAADEDIQAVAELFYAGDTIDFLISDMSTGSGTAIGVDVTFDGTVEEFVAWNIPA